jgi:hypothetical protein
MMGEERGDLTSMLESFEGEKTEEEPSLDLDRQPTQPQVTQPRTTPSQSDQFAIGTVCLYDWFEANQRNLPGITHTKVSIKDVNPKKFLIYKFPVLDSETGEWDIDMRKDAHVYQVLDMPGYAMMALTNGFVILYRYEDKFLKAYWTRTGLIIVFCIEVEGTILIPYARVKLKKRGKGINIPGVDSTSVIQKLARSTDIEAVMLLYPQFEKFREGINTNQDVLVWFTQRQLEMRDTTHLLQIDNVLISIFA